METGRQKRSYRHSSSKGYGECHGSAGAGVRMGYVIGDSGGEGETRIKDFPLSVVFLIF